MVQIITGCIIVLLGIYIFIKYPIKRDTKSIVLAALFVVITAILKRLSIMIPLFGFPALKIGFEMIPMMISGMVLSPSYGFLIGISVDLVGLMVMPTEFPFLGFTLNSILMSCMPSILLEKTRKMRQKTLEYVLMMLITSIVGFASVYILMVDTITISQNVITVTSIYKFLIIGFCIMIYILLWIGIRYKKKKVHQNDLQMLYIWMIAVILIELSITFILTPYWLQVMYEIPFMLSLFVRVIKECVMIPFDIIVGYQLLRVLKKI